MKLNIFLCVFIFKVVTVILGLMPVLLKFQTILDYFCSVETTSFSPSLGVSQLMTNSPSFISSENIFFISFSFLEDLEF